VQKMLNGWHAVKEFFDVLFLILRIRHQRKVLLTVMIQNSGYLTLQITQHSVVPTVLTGYSLGIFPRMTPF